MGGMGFLGRAAGRLAACLSFGHHLTAVDWTQSSVFGSSDVLRPKLTNWSEARRPS